MTLEVLLAVNIKIMVWNVMPFGVVDKYQRFGGTCCLHLQGRKVRQELKERSRRFFQNIVTYLPIYLVSHLKKTIILTIFRVIVLLSFYDLHCIYCIM
jgi:hypothetical protein